MNIKIKKHLLLFKDYKLKCAIGKSGITKYKKEGDGVHVELQRRQVLLRPLELRRHPSQGHPRKAKTAEPRRKGRQ